MDNVSYKNEREYKCGRRSDTPAVPRTQLNLTTTTAPTIGYKADEENDYNKRKYYTVRLRTRGQLPARMYRGANSGVCSRIVRRFTTLKKTPRKYSVRQRLWFRKKIVFEKRRYKRIAVRFIDFSHPVRRFNEIATCLLLTDFIDKSRSSVLERV